MVVVEGHFFGGCGGGGGLEMESNGSPFSLLSASSMEAKNDVMMGKKKEWNEQSLILLCGACY